MIRLGDKVPVAPLDPARLAAIEENLLAALPAVAAPPRRRARRVAVAAAAATALAAAALVLFWAGRSGSPEPLEVVSTAPSMQVAQPAVRELGSEGSMQEPGSTGGHPASPAGTGEVLGKEPKEMDPSDRSRPAVVALDGAALAIRAGSRVAVRNQPGGGIVVELSSGRVDCDVEPRPGRPPFAVHAGDVTVEVVGTRFSVEHGGDVSVAVERGVVRVAAAGRAPVNLIAGEEWRRSATARIAANDPGAPSVLDAALRDDASGSGPILYSGAAEAPSDGTGSSSGSSWSSMRALARRLGWVGSAASASDSKTNDSKTNDSKTNDSKANGKRAAVGGREASRPGAVGGGGEASRPGADGGAASGPGALGGGRLAGLPELACRDIDSCAVTAFRETGAPAGRALYSLIYLELVESKNPAQALTLAELYERRFARRRLAEAEAVLWLRVLAHGQAGDEARRRDAARDYLARHPRGRFAWDARRLVGP